MLKNLALRALVALHGVGTMVQDDEGQTLAEYGMIVAVIAVAIVSSAGIVFRGTLIGVFNRATTCLNGSC